MVQLYGIKSSHAVLTWAAGFLAAIFMLSLFSLVAASSKMAAPIPAAVDP